MKIILGLLLAFGIGALCKLTGIPVPAPPVIVGALLVVAMTSGYLLVDRFASHRASRQSESQRSLKPNGSGRAAGSTRSVSRASSCT